jgi:DNA polymerase-3 subunit delta'
MSSDDDRLHTEAETDAVAGPPPIDLLPWHGDACDRLSAAVANARLPHGLVLQGPAGVGKEHFASALAAALVCTGRGNRLEACGQCADCRLSRAGSHPDVHWVRPLEDKKSIGVDQIREVCEKLAMTSMRGGHRVATIVPADWMTVAAQNSLLKTLEEPAARTMLLLVTARPSRLLPTLHSRCQRVELARPDGELAARWLEGKLGHRPPPRLLPVTGGAPFKALALAPHFEGLEAQMSQLLEAFLAGRVDVTRAAAEMQGEGLPARLDWIEGWLGSRLRQACGLQDENALTVRGHAVLQRPPAELNITAAFQVVDRLRETRRLLEGSASAPLVVEALLLELRAALMGAR